MSRYFSGAGYGRCLKSLAHEINEPLKSFSIHRAVAADDSLREILLDRWASILEGNARSFRGQFRGFFFVRMHPLHSAQHRLEIADGELAVRLGPMAVNDKAVKL